MKIVVGLCAIFLVYSIAAAGASFQPQSKTDERYFVFDPKTGKWSAYENGHRVRSGHANGGAPNGHETPAGVYHIFTKKGPDYRSSKYPINPDGSRGGAPMPYAMHFTKSGHAIHGAPSLSRENSTHGCIRVKTSTAKWLSESFMTPSTKVVVQPYH